MPFGVVSGVGRGISEVDGVEIVEWKGQFWGRRGASHCNQRDSLREGRLRGSCQITLGLLAVRAVRKSVNTCVRTVSKNRVT